MWYILRYIGGIIGKKGATIKKLTQESGAQIEVVTNDDVTSFYE